MCKFCVYFSQVRFVGNKFFLLVKYERVRWKNTMEKLYRGSTHIQGVNHPERSRLGVDWIDEICWISWQVCGKHINHCMCGLTEANVQWWSNLVYRWKYIRATTYNTHHMASYYTAYTCSYSHYIDCKCTYDYLQGGSIFIILCVMWTR